MNAILQTMREMNLKYGEIALCRLGQFSFLVKLGKTLLAVDPYLTPEARRLIPPPVPAEDFSVDLICCTHNHRDHLDRLSLGVMAEASPHAKLVVPEAICSAITEFPQNRIIGINEPDTMTFGDVQISAIASAHEFLDRTPEGKYPYLGYIIRGNGVTLYHSGDCCRYEGLAVKLAAFGIDIALLPINGRDAERYERNVIGNMTYQEAADLAGSLQVPLSVPAHYDMFAGNCEDPEKFTRYMRAKYPSLGTRILAPGEIVLVSGKDIRKHGNE